MVGPSSATIICKADVTFPVDYTCQLVNVVILHEGIYTTKTFYSREQITDFLKEHIIRGDVGDGIPNYLSPDDVFVAGGRQKPIMAVKVETWVQQQPEEFCNETTLKNYYRNKTLVDLDEIPAEVQAAILEEFAVPVIGSVNKIYSYLVRHRMKNLLELIREF